VSECTHNCETCGENCPSKGGAQDLHAKLNELSSVKKVIGIVSGKGGVGKSVVTSMLSVLLKRRGFHTAVLDADVTGPSIPGMFGVTGNAEGSDVGIFPKRTKTGIDIISTNLLLEDASAPVVWRGPVIANLVQQFWSDVIWKDVDYMFVDMPPGTGDVPLTVFQSLPVDGIVIVASPQELVSMIVTKAVKMAEMMNIPILGLVENMSYVVCPDCGKQIPFFGEGHTQEIADKHNLKLLAKIPVDPSIARVCDGGMIELFEGNWLDAVADEIETICKIEQ